MIRLTAGPQGFDVNFLLLPIKENSSHPNTIQKAADRSQFVKLLNTDRKTYKHRESVTPSEATPQEQVAASQQLDTNGLREQFFRGH